SAEKQPIKLSWRNIEWLLAMLSNNSFICKYSFFSKVRTIGGSFIKSTGEKTNKIFQNSFG
ncbi:hypothetical protein PL592_21015, partial [Phocaeicola vulgatus]|nr:hypothetical protein [Phocaeicola vulgatus]